CLAAMLSSTPPAGAGTSIVTLSVSSSTTGSSAATVSPTCLNHWPIVASVTLSPSVGTRISTAIVPTLVAAWSAGVWPLPRGDARASLLGERLVEESLQLRQMRPHQARGRGGRSRPPHIVGALAAAAHLVQHPVDIGLHEGPGAHVLGLLLAPVDLGLAETAEF